jgi:ABC-type transport system substrate-binding protein
MNNKINSHKKLFSFGNTWIFYIVIIFSILAVPQLMSGQDEELQIFENEYHTGLDAYSSLGSESRRFVSLYCRPLFIYICYDREGGSVYELAIASSYERKENNLVVKINSNKYFYFYNESGKKDSLKVTARDVVTTYRNLTNENSKFRDTYYSDRLESWIKSAGIINDSTIRFTFNDGYFPTEKVLDFPIIPYTAVPEQTIVRNPKKNTYQAKYQKEPSGCGPFLYKKSITRGIELYKFERCVKDHGNSFSSLTMRVENEDIRTINKIRGVDDLSNILFPSLSLGVVSELQNTSFKYTRLINPVIEEIIFNCSKPQLRDKRVRAALSVYIDREELMTLKSNYVDLITGPIPHGFIGYCKDCEIPNYSYNPDLGDSLLQAAGYRRHPQNQKWIDNNGITLRISILGYSGSKGNVVSEIVNGINNKWRNHGIDVSDPVQVEKTIHQDKIKNGDFEAAFHVLEYNIIPRLGRHFLPGGEENYSRVNISNADSTWKSITDPTQADTRQYWYKMHEMIANEIPCAFLWSPHSYMAYTSWIDTHGKWYPHNVLQKVHEWTVQD